MSFASHNVSIELNHDTSGSDLQLFEKPRDTEPAGDLTLLSVYANLHLN